MSDKTKNKLTIAIDGHAGSGKTTVSKRLASLLKYDYIDTGAMYRAITLKTLELDVDINDYERITEIALMSQITFNGRCIQLDDEDVTEDIRSPLVNNNVSLVARIPGVREAMVSQQRSLANKGGVIVEGRDIGTVVLPGANKKFFLTASPKERGKRRYKELVEKGVNITYKEVMENVNLRDEIDSTRAVAPLKPAEDAIIIDTSDYTIDEVVEILMDRINK